MSADAVTIRFAETSDADELLRHVYISADVLTRKIAAEEIAVAVAGDELIGLIQLEYLWSKVPYIALIRVAPEHRRRGIGKKMMGYIESHLSEWGHAVIYSSSQADEPGPQEWHRHMGFEECGVIKEINDGIDEIFFRKSFSKI